jgi:hypothetical protein
MDQVQDGIPQDMWSAAFEYEPGQPVGSVLFQFKVETKRGAFNLSFYEWQQHFISGRNEHISGLGITIKTS